MTLLPSGTPCPDIMTQDECATLLRLEGRDTAQSLDELRRRGLPHIQIGKLPYKYPRDLVLQWVNNKAKEKAR